MERDIPKACLTCYFYKYMTDKTCCHIDSFFYDLEKEEGDSCNLHEYATWRLLNLSNEEIQRKIKI